MKDALDTKTIDFVEQSVKQKRGRPAKYKSAAEKQRAYRDRCKQERLVKVRGLSFDDRYLLMRGLACLVDEKPDMFDDVKLLLDRLSMSSVYDNLRSTN